MLICFRKKLFRKRKLEMVATNYKSRELEMIGQRFEIRILDSITEKVMTAVFIATSCH